MIVLNKFIDFFTLLLTWKPPDLWETYFPIAMETLHNSIWGWLTAQVARLVQLLVTVALSFPVDFLESNSFQEIYFVCVVAGFAILQGATGFRAVATAWGKRNKFSKKEVYQLAIRIIIGFTVIFEIPRLFAILSKVAANLTTLLFANVSIIAMPASAGLEELSFIVLVVVVVFLVFRLLLYYAVRNVYLLLLVLIAPIRIMQWAFSGDYRKLEKWGTEITGLFLIQLIHALLLVLLTKLAMNPVPEISAGIWNLFSQIGVMQLMLNTGTLLNMFFEGVPNLDNQAERIAELVKSKGVSVFE